GRPLGDRRGRQQDRGVLLDHVEWLLGIEVLVAGVLRAVDDQRPLGQPYGQIVHELLDPAGARREVVRDEQRGHRSPRANARAAAIRSTTDGWVANIRYSQRGGSTSARLVVASRCSMTSTVDGSWVTASACASARASIRRETAFCSGAPTSPATAARASSRPTARGSPIESAPALLSRPVQEPSRKTTQTAAAAPRAPRAVPVSTSLSLACPSSCATTASTSPDGASRSSVS